MNDLIERYYPDILRISRSICQREHEDLAHDVVLKLHKNRFKLKNSSKKQIISYIFVMVLNQSRAIHNKQKSQIYIDDKDFAIEPQNDYIKLLNDIIEEANISHTDKLWLDAFLEMDLNASWVESRIGVSRACAKRRFNKVLNKLKIN